MKYKETGFEVICSGGLGVSALCIVQKPRRELDPAPGAAGPKAQGQVQFCASGKLFPLKWRRAAQKKAI